MAIRERLHHVLGRQGGMDHGSAGDKRLSVQVERRGSSSIDGGALSVSLISFWLEVCPRDKSESGRGFAQVRAISPAKPSLRIA